MLEAESASSSARERLLQFLSAESPAAKIERLRLDQAFLQSPEAAGAFEDLRLERADDPYSARFFAANRRLIQILALNGVRAAENVIAEALGALQKFAEFQTNPRAEAIFPLLQIGELLWTPYLWCESAVSLSTAALYSAAGRNDPPAPAIALMSDAAQSARIHSFRDVQANAEHDLGVILINRPGATPADFETAYQFVRNSISLYEQIGWPGDDPKDRRYTEANSRMSLGFVTRERRLGDAESNLSEALDSFNRALQGIRQDEFPLLTAQIKNHIGLVYMKRKSGEPALNLEQAIHHFESALDTFPPGTPANDLGSVHINLSLAYTQRQLGGKSDNIERAILHGESAVRTFPLDSAPWQWAKAQNNLGIAYGDRLAGNRAENRERAVRHLEAALEIRTRDRAPSDWARGKWNLSRALPARLVGSLANNQEAGIHAAEEALTVYTRDQTPNEWAQVLVNVANIYIDRVSGEKADNLERARDCLERAESAIRRETLPDVWAGIRHLLASVYAYRLYGSRAENIETSIALNRQALEVRIRELYPIDWAATTSSLALCYRHRVLGERVDNLETARRLIEDSIAVYSREDFPLEWASEQRNLANIWSDRTDGDAADNAQHAVAHLQAALAVVTPESDAVLCAGCHNNLGYLFTNLPYGNPESNREKARRHLQQALAQEPDPVRRRQTLRNLANLELISNNWRAALDTYNDAIALGVGLLDGSFTDAGRRYEIGETSYLYARAAYCLYRMGDPSSALIHLERGKAQFLDETLILRDDRGERLPPAIRPRVAELRREAQLLNNELRLPAATPGRRPEQVLGAALREIKTEIQALLPQTPETPADLDSILSAIAPNEIAIAPIMTPAGSMAFILPHGTLAITPEHLIDLDPFDTADFLYNRAHSGWMDSYLRRGANLQSWFDTIDRSTHQLWIRLMGPIADRVAARDAGSQIVLLQQGGLGVLPLAAAWREPPTGGREYFLDRYPLRYAPSFRVMAETRAWMTGGVTSGARPAVFGVFNPTADLPYADEEADALAAHCDSSRSIFLSGNDATVQAVHDSISGHTHLHFACHGAYFWQNPLASGLVLADGMLTLAEILALRFTGVRLAALSACETGITDISQAPDEYFGIPLGFLSAGVPGVIATLWAVDDRCAALVMDEVYRALADDVSPGEALRRAQIALRSMTARDLGDRFASFLRMTPKAAQEALFHIHTAFAPDDCPYAHPYYWAAFTMVGS